MKKAYIIPAIQINETVVSEMLAVSIIEGSADGEQPVLSKENTWDIWSEEE